VRRRDDLEVGWFVPEARLADYAEDERVYELDEHGHRRLRRHAKGSFIYRLSTGWPGAIARRARATTRRRC